MEERQIESWTEDGVDVTLIKKGEKFRLEVEGALVSFITPLFDRKGKVMGLKNLYVSKVLEYDEEVSAIDNE